MSSDKNDKEKIRKSALVIAVLLIIIIAASGFTVYYCINYIITSSNLSQTRLTGQIGNETIAEINSTTPHVVISLAFTPEPQYKTVPPNSVTYLTAVLTATNLSNLFFPCSLLATFSTSYTTSNPNGTVYMNYIHAQAVSLLKGMTIVEIPWGVFPFSVYNFRPGDIITVYAIAQVMIAWQPVGGIMTNQIVTTNFTVTIGGF